MDVVAQFELLSDAAQVAWAGGACLAFALFASLMEWRRTRTRNLARLEQVGWVPWTGLFVLSAMLGAGLLAMALPVVIRGN
ncbi:hypothetical protein [Erythrobacter sp. CCH5-A1]|jgi:hypothetical protein|uniref:hypothetical protein n=1 Tax=Erythrobacter sp. CCH5-A1 TaxID=1768792 RepID=UPI00083466B8|nr:hypothetical protein [Erythrobacter sp. CCH5-A1]